MKLIASGTEDALAVCTVKPFNLAALKVGNFTCKFILAPFLLENSNHTTLRQHTVPITVGILSIFALFNFAILFSSRNKEHPSIMGFTVLKDACMDWPDLQYF